jgi:hypothetical protein
VPTGRAVSVNSPLSLTRSNGRQRGSLILDFGGAGPTYADYLLFSVFQYARLGYPDEFVAEASALRRWRGSPAMAFDGLGNRYPAHPASQPDPPDSR